MYDDLWTAAKAMYKTEPAIADGGEVIIYAPHLSEVSYTHGKLIDQVGYHVRDYFLKQWERFKDSRPETAADEIVRWATPITVFQRTATQDTELGGQQIKAGQRVGLFYRSANFDEEVFDEPGRFDVLRDPNPHLGYGGLGTHYCLGASLAKLEIQLIFNAIADAMPDLTRSGDPVRLRSGWINGIKSLPVTYRP